MKQQKGFTLIELIIVIVILGILAVTAAPRFFDFSKDARASTVEGLEASVKGAAELIYAKSLIAGTASNPSTTVEGIDTVYGYPAATADGLLKALSTGTQGDWKSGAAGADVVVDAATGDFLIFPSGKELTDSEDVDTACFLFYREPTAAGEAPTTGTVTAGC